MTYSKRQWKNFKIQTDWDLFNRSRNYYFYAIKETKNKSWTNFLNNAKNKDIFQAYKYIKVRGVKKLSFIEHNNKTKIYFEEKCDALIEAIFSSSFEDDEERSSSPIDITDLFDVESNFQDRQHRWKWEKVIYGEIKNAIFSSSLKKALDLDKILFFILQKSYHAIFDLFCLILFEWIDNNYYSKCWKKRIEVILRKSNKVDYLQSKAYRIIMLLNRLRKRSERTIATRLSYLVVSVPQTCPDTKSF